MQTTSRTDEDLLAARDATSFELFYLHHVNTVLGSSPAAPATPRWRPT
jgi:hypothetical protein